MGQRFTTPEERYDWLRKRAAQQNASATQQQQDAMQRRFSAMGALNTGAAVKANENISRQGQDALNQATGQIDVAQAQEAAQQAEAEKQRQFAKGERLASQGWQSGENIAQRQFAREERIGGQGFAKSMQEMQQNWQSKEARAARDWQDVWNEREMKFKESSFADQMDMANRQFELDTKISEFNMQMAQKMSKQKSFAERALDPFGTLGAIGGNAGGLKSAFGG